MHDAYDGRRNVGGNRVGVGGAELVHHRHGAGRDPGAVRFAWVFTPNWIGRLCKKQKLPIYGIVQFVELKDGQVYDFTMHGGGYNKEIEH